MFGVKQAPRVRILAAVGGTPMERTVLCRVSALASPDRLYTPQGHTPAFLPFREAHLCEDEGHELVWGCDDLPPQALRLVGVC